MISKDIKVPTILMQELFKVIVETQSSVTSPLDCQCTLKSGLLSSASCYGGELSPVNPQIERSPLVGCPRLLVQYIHDRLPYLEAVSSVRNQTTRSAVVARDPLKKGKRERVPRSYLYLHLSSSSSSLVAPQPCKWALASSRTSFYRVRLSASRQTPNLEDQASVFISPGYRVAQLYPRTVGSSGTSGSPFLVPTYVGPWGGELSTFYSFIYWCCIVSSFELSVIKNLVSHWSKTWRKITRAGGSTAPEKVVGVSKATERLRSVVMSKKFRTPYVSGCALRYFLCSELYPKSDFFKIS
jgi:hypothetical protein